MSQGAFVLPVAEDRFTAAGLATVRAAAEEASALRSDVVGTEHLLLAVICLISRDRPDLPTPRQVRDVIADIGVEASGVQGFGELTPRATTVLRLADVAAEREQAKIGATHLVAALRQEGEGVGMLVASELGLVLDEPELGMISASEPSDQPQ